MNPLLASCFLGNVFSTPIPGPDTFWHLKHVPRAERLYHAGDGFHGLFQATHGSFKTVSSARSGFEQVLDFHFPGDFMGMDAISENVYRSTAVALQDSEVCVLSYSGLHASCANHSDVQSNVDIAMGREIRRKAEIITLLGYTSVEERVVVFLLDLLGRAAIGADELPLPMKRWEIASFLAISHETLSREFRKLQRLGLIRAHANSIRILDRPALELRKGPMTDVRFSWTKTSTRSIQAAAMAH